MGPVHHERSGHGGSQVPGPGRRRATPRRAARGGRPDLAAEHLHDVRSPTLLIVGGRDSIVVDLNRVAARHLRAEHRLEIVPGATHLFEEPGALAQVAHLATSWFLAHCT